MQSTNRSACVSKQMLVVNTCLGHNLAVYKTFAAPLDQHALNASMFCHSWGRVGRLGEGFSLATHFGAHVSAHHLDASPLLGASGLQDTMESFRYIWLQSKGSGASCGWRICRRG